MKNCLIEVPGFVKTLTGNRYTSMLIGVESWISLWANFFLHFFESYDTEEIKKSPGDSVQMQTHFYFDTFTSFNSLTWTLPSIQLVSPMQLLPWACLPPIPDFGLGYASCLECYLFPYAHPFSISFLSCTFTDLEEVVIDGGG